MYRKILEFQLSLPNCQETPRPVSEPIPNPPPVVVRAVTVDPLKIIREKLDVGQKYVHRMYNHTIEILCVDFSREVVTFIEHQHRCNRHIRTLIQNYKMLETDSVVS